MHMDYWTYRKQPQEFINEIIAHMNAESEATEANNRLAQRRK